MPLRASAAAGRRWSTQTVMPSKIATCNADKHRAEVGAQGTCHAAQEQQKGWASRQELEGTLATGTGRKHDERH